MSTVEDTHQRTIENGPLPAHPDRVEGTLANGLRYVIVPNKIPPERFEAHLEVLSGSVHEFERQQGMAHLLEHIAYMGSPKRQLISGTGSRTNAYTDFHHTVFFAQCPTQTPGDQFWRKSMLPMALDALLDVMTTKVDEDRLEKERAAVLSEASMVNKMEYRVECQVLSALHSENRISKRFPIGKEDLIKSWTREEVLLYHQIHYRPDNVILYVIGDVTPAATIDLINQKFGSLKPTVDANLLIQQSGEYPPVSMRNISPHFPPVVHQWSSSIENTKRLLPAALVEATAPVPAPVSVPVPGGETARDVNLPRPRIFQHELLQAFSFHLFAKRPMEPIVDKVTLREDIMRRLALSALQIRFNVEQRQHPLFTFIDFNQMNWPREGCTVCSLDLTTETANWREAVTVAIMEIRRLGLYGLTDGELERYKVAVLSEAQQFAAQAQQMSSEDMLTEVMEAQACGHTFMSASQRLSATQTLLDTITLEDVNQASRQLCEHLSHPDGVSVRPCAAVACAPALDREGLPFEVTEQEVLSVIEEAMSLSLSPPVNTEVPLSLISRSELTQRMARTKPAWVDLDGKAAETHEIESAKRLGVIQRKLNNGIKVNIKSLAAEPQRVSVRMYVPGGRLLEHNSKPGAVSLGARTVQEGGACEGYSREEVELFCIDHLVMVDIAATEDSLIFDFQSVTSPGPGGEGVTGLEAVMQVAHIILTDIVWEEDAFERAKLGLHEYFDSVVKGLETACQERLTQTLSGGDQRFCTANHKQLDALSLEDVRDAVSEQLAPSRVEISICGDMSSSVLEKLCLAYLGTVPSREEKKTSLSSLSTPGLGAQLLARRQSSSEKTEKKEDSPVGAPINTIGVFLPDSDERSMGYLAGPAPNKYGLWADGTSIQDAMLVGCGKKDRERRSHVLFPMVALMVLQEVANRRLFSVVREERQLTYDASFSLHNHEGVAGGWYQVSVTSSPSQVQEALRACREALRSLRGTFGVMGDSVQSAKRTLVNRQRSESQTNKFWVESMSGVQVSSVPVKGLGVIADFESVLAGITVQDIHRLMEVLVFDEREMTACVGISSPSPPPEMIFQQ
eukprot:CAMPEP_0182419444 /NCGR_PEP_ID=MMETSP1167-20130531/3899_1 /TAXON_ID=2988 /ORGANISM="Mallomonas Sp, Strain CCMP3275" /LENGTH=1078 /DNA_ID=CAMNT_0024594381 /DNA_START=315 /DNA_END=3551 /DNA_ORIENTATION=+